jgi:hypothetical protein
MHEVHCNNGSDRAHFMICDINILAGKASIRAGIKSCLTLNTGNAAQVQS